MNIGPDKKFFRWKGKVCSEATHKKRLAQVKSGENKKKRINNSLR